MDEANGIAFIPFGSRALRLLRRRPTQATNLFGNSLVALDARTGKRLWHQQLVHHDLWDYDLPQAPKLLTIRQDGRPSDVVAQATKHGFLFVFDRRTGEPIWPIEERPVPQSERSGRALRRRRSRSRRSPRRSPSSRSPSATSIRICRTASKRHCATKLRTSRNEGLFTPPSFAGSIGMPGHNGGANWGGSAVDPINGELYVVSKNLPVMLRVELSDEEPTARTMNGPVVTTRASRRGARRSEGRGGERPGALRRRRTTSCAARRTAWRAIGPPWAHLTAYDLNTGEIKWRVPHGSATGLARRDTGAHFPRGAPLVTAGGLVFVATAQDRRCARTIAIRAKCCGRRSCPAAPKGFRPRTRSAAANTLRCRSRLARVCSRRPPRVRRRAPRGRAGVRGVRAAAPLARARRRTAKRHGCGAQSSVTNRSDSPTSTVSTMMNV